MGYAHQLLFSGGQDSNFLLSTLLVKKPFSFVQLTTIQHESQPDSFFLLEHTQRYSLVIQKLNTLGFLNIYYYSYRSPFTCLRWVSTKQKNENIFRNFRYQATTRLAYFYNSSCQITGHTRTDYTETVFLNLLRGAALQGLTTNFFFKTLLIRSYHRTIRICWFNNLLQPKLKQKKIYSKKKQTTIRLTNTSLYFKLLYRPGIEYSRTHIARFQKSSSLPCVFDQTNHFLEIQRNKIRRHLLSYIKFYFNTNFELLFFKTSNVVLDFQFAQNQLFVLFKTLPFSLSLEKVLIVDLLLVNSFPSRLIKCLLEGLVKDRCFESIENLETIFFHGDFTGYLVFSSKKILSLKTQNFLILLI
jgi:tRNA(Ile)-lysidine synthase TilS/MesJ